MGQSQMMMSSALHKPTWKKWHPCPFMKQEINERVQFLPKMEGKFKLETPVFELQT